MIDMREFNEFLDDFGWFLPAAVCLAWWVVLAVWWGVLAVVEIIWAYAQ